MRLSNHFPVVGERPSMDSGVPVAMTRSHASRNGSRPASGNSVQMRFPSSVLGSRPRISAARGFTYR